ncbi:hypothetical protein BVC80_9097g21 [Macleaya cordata]|uniref:Uncharacterized protein n=1 Tax=Macleaya cordata TaxID=56857 RepID=A0A200QET7_MACCD|nr:hypothetical protein BVC80_9097g21 [Macleaya cordata]
MYEKGIGGEQIEPLEQAEIESATHMDTLLSEFPYNGIELEVASEMRDAIAAEMWNDHIRDLSNLGFDQ